MLEVLQPFEPELYWVLSLALAIAFLLAFSVGANDVSNSFGTSVGSRVLTVTQACILATFFEVAGATLLGYSVCDTFRRNMYDVELYKESQRELMLGALACLIGSASWNMLATALKMPISGTHSIVGATVGFSIVLRGWSSIKWFAMLRIIASWFASPLLSGFISSLIYLLISKTIIRKANPLKTGLKSLPLFYGATIFINVASVVINGPEVFGLNTLPWYAGLFISLVVSGITICFVAMHVVPKMRSRIQEESLNSCSSNGNDSNQKGKKTAAPAPAPATATTTTSLSLEPQPKLAMKSDKGYDNVAFKPDTSQPAKAELTLNAGKLATDQADTQAAATDKPTRPPIAPKPAYLLRRQMEMEEIDLGPPTPLKRSTDVESNGGGGGGDALKASPSASGRPGMIRGERFEVFRLFSSLQILTACFASFAHGTNDVSNAVAPLVPIWNIFVFGQEDIRQPTQIWILAFGGIGICTGLWAWGRAVMGTVGDGLTQLTPSKGFAIELGAAISVLAATKLGLPISTTHCKVGSVVIVGLISSKYCSQDNLLDMSDEERELESKKKAVDWKLFGNIVITWIVTVPLAASASAGVMYLLKWLTF